MLLRYAAADIIFTMPLRRHFDMLLPLRHDFRALTRYALLRAADATPVCLMPLMLPCVYLFTLRCHAASSFSLPC